MARYLTNEDAPTSALEPALHGYIARIATELGVGAEATLCELSDRASAYIALSERCSAYPDQDLALLWDQQCGWSLATEPHPGGALNVLAYHGHSLVPEPGELVTFVYPLSSRKRPGQGQRQLLLTSPTPNSPPG
ncbi:DUF6292 family protein [Sciscionella sediminilitoris]|uniref:DUF6292 family protein n=1 Tax=Sciscionella sediminilitoris TaxID=1445613 RepID=UPI003CCD8D99